MIDWFDLSRDVVRFRRRKELLGRLLKRFAVVNEVADGTRIYVACQARRVIAYFSPTVGAV